MNLQKNERFQEDVKKYSELIAKMEDGQNKLEARQLLDSLIYEVKNMDNMYLDMVYAKQLTSTGNDMREKIISIRKKIDSKLKNL